MVNTTADRVSRDNHNNNSNIALTKENEKMVELKRQKTLNVCLVCLTFFCSLYFRYFVGVFSICLCLSFLFSLVKFSSFFSHRFVIYDYYFVFIFLTFSVCLLGIRSELSNPNWSFTFRFVFFSSSIHFHLPEIDVGCVNPLSIKTKYTKTLIRHHTSVKVIVILCDYLFELNNLHLIDAHQLRVNANFSVMLCFFRSFWDQISMEYFRQIITKQSSIRLIDDIQSISIYEYLKCKLIEAQLTPIFSAFVISPG